MNLKEIISDPHQESLSSLAWAKSSNCDRILEGGEQKFHSFFDQVKNLHEAEEQKCWYLRGLKGTVKKVLCCEAVDKL